MRPISQFSAANAKIADWLAEGGEFELPVLLLEPSDDNHRARIEAPWG
jgi:hypothetical protein